MENALYRKNVLKTLSLKPAKLGLKYVLKNQRTVNILHTAVGLSTEVGELFAGLSDYISGASRFTDDMRVNAFEECGDIGYYVVALAKQLKAKIPGSGKKVKLKGTRTAALLELLRLSTDILSLNKKVFYGPKMSVLKEHREKKVFDVDAAGLRIPTGTMNKFNKPEYSFKLVDTLVEIYHVDLPGTEAMWVEREAQMILLLQQFCDIFWALVYDLFEVTPSNVFVGNIAKLEKRYGKGFFDLSDSESRETEEEIEAMKTAVVEAPAKTKTVKPKVAKAEKNPQSIAQTT